jgi:hypothetical protein
MSHRIIGASVITENAIAISGVYLDMLGFPEASQISGLIFR